MSNYSSITNKAADLTSQQGGTIEVPRVGNQNIDSIVAALKDSEIVSNAPVRSTSAPGSPSIGTVWEEMRNNTILMSWIWTGTDWESTQLYFNQTSFLAVGTSSTKRIVAGAPGNTNWTRYRYVGLGLSGSLPGGTYDASNTFQLQGALWNTSNTLVNVGPSILSHNEIPQNVGTRNTSILINAVYDGSTYPRIGMSWTMIGTPPTLLGFLTCYYKLLRG